MIARVDGNSDLASREVGGKAARLADLARQGFSVPPTIALSTEVYRDYLQQTPIGVGLPLLIGRKPFSDMRWEELWDLALQIRNLFVTTPLPQPMADTLIESLPQGWLDCPLVVRSSAPDEDGQSHSFAGLHESVVGICGRDPLLEAVRTVWASLWSDRALLYRQELGLSPDSAMAVVIQPLIDGEASGVLFTTAPDDGRYQLIEAVHGLNEGLVDGQVAPDRWRLDRRDGSVASHHPAAKRQRWVRGAEGAQIQAAPPEPPLQPAALQQLYTIGKELENVYKTPQDVEWTLAGDRIILLQLRPITTLDTDPERQWYLSLAPSLEALQTLRTEIETQVLPTMKQDATTLLATPLQSLADPALAAHLLRCRERLEHWEAVYRDQLIPMAHGIRLFGQIYNDHLKPADSFEFTQLLQQGSLLAVKRNRILQRLATRPAAAQQRWLQRLAPLFAAQGLSPELLQRLVHQGEQAFKAPAGTVHSQEQAFFAHFPAEERPWAAQLLDLGRAAWRLRDDDNLYMEAMREPFRATVQEIERRLQDQPSQALTELNLTMPKLSLPRKQFESPPPVPEPPPERWRQQGRQLIGQPASAGVASGPARLITQTADLADFQAGEVLVCDALDPTLTLVAPLAAAIVERRGGMLIHGAIIAREYGLPCVTGVPRAAEFIQTGDQLTVDGHLGLVTIDTKG